MARKAENLKEVRSAEDFMTESAICLEQVIIRTEGRQVNEPRPSFSINTTINTQQVVEIQKLLGWIWEAIKVLGVPVVMLLLKNWWDRKEAERKTEKQKLMDMEAEREKGRQIWATDITKSVERISETLKDIKGDMEKQNIFNAQTMENQKAMLDKINTTGKRVAHVIRRQNELEQKHMKLEDKISEILHPKRNTRA